MSTSPVPHTPDHLTYPIRQVRSPATCVLLCQTHRLDFQPRRSYTSLFPCPDSRYTIRGSFCSVLFRPLNSAFARVLEHTPINSAQLWPLVASLYSSRSLIRQYWRRGPRTKTPAVPRWPLIPRLFNHLHHALAPLSLASSVSQASRALSWLAPHTLQHPPRPHRPQESVQSLLRTQPHLKAVHPCLPSPCESNNIRQVHESLLVALRMPLVTTSIAPKRRLCLLMDDPSSTPTSWSQSLLALMAE